VTEDLYAPRASQGQRIDRRHVHMLDCLSEQAAEHPDRMDGECESARKGAEPDGGHEQQRPDQVRDGTGESDHAPRGVIEKARRRQIGSRENGERQGHDNAAEGPENAEVDCFERRPPHHVDLAEIGRHRASDDVCHAVGAGNQILRPGTDDDRRLHNDRHQRKR
jgi:hypothetical protein